MSESSEATRTLPGLSGKLIRILLIAVPVVAILFILDLPARLGFPVLREQYFGLFFAMTMPCIFWLIPAWKGAPRSRISWYDHLFALGAIVCGMYVALYYPDILRTLGDFGPRRTILAATAVILVLEAVRRTAGMMLATVGIITVLYGHFTWMAPGVFGGPGTPWPELLTYLYLDMSGLFGITLSVTAVIIISFIIFGNLLFAVGGSTFLMNFAIAVFGKYRGGPAKMVIGSSALFGMLSGSAAANVASTGVFTIPLMKRVGYTPRTAGAIEAVASTGGSLSPPIMGAAAFLIAEFTGIPYVTVAIAAIIPTLLYFIAVFMQVDLDAAKLGLKGIPEKEIPPLRDAMSSAYLFLIPFTALLLTLFLLKQSPERSAFVGILAILCVSLFSASTRLRLDWIIGALFKTGKTMLSLTAIVCMAGLIIGVVNVSGLGFVLPLYLTQIAGDSLLPVLLLVAASCIVLGLGMPTVAVYILLGVLMAPTLVELGVPVLAAHLFILFLGTASQFTPPVCIAAFAAASIAEADPMETSFTSVRIGALIYIVPFLFAYSSAFLMVGTPLEILWALFTAIIGCYFLTIASVGYFVRPLQPLLRLLFLPLAFLAFTGGLDLTGSVHTDLALFLAGLIGGCLILFYEWSAARKTQAAV